MPTTSCVPRAWTSRRRATGSRGARPSDRQPLAHGDPRAPQRPGRLRQRLREVRLALAGQLLRTQRQEDEGDRPDLRQRRHRQGHRGVDRPAGRVDDGARLPGRLRAQGQLAVRVDRADDPLPRAVRRSAPAAAHAPPRPRGPLAFGVSVAFFNDANIDASVPLAYPLAALPARAHAVDRPAPQPAPRPAAPARAGVVAGRRAALPRRLSHRAERRELQRDRRRLRGRHRRRPPGRRREAVGERSPRTTSTATRTGRSTTPPTCPFEQLLPWSGRWDDLPAAHAAADRLRPAVPGPAVPHRAAHARADPRARAGLRVGGEPVHALRAGLQRQRRARRRARARRDRGAPSSPAGRGAFVALAGMAKFAPLALAPLFATLLARRAARSSLGAALASLAPLPAAGPRLRRPARRSTTGRWASRPRAARRSRSGGSTTGTRRRRWSRPPAVAAGRGRRLPAAAARRRRARGAGRGRAHRAAARRDALVLPLHRVVPRAAAHRAARARRSRGAASRTSSCSIASRGAA